ncbi:hypothetical protein FQA39_LY02983 [Lamprigera yunnana]|nr:hypothetical protein FQA39_LY02983 [Lamprigera yunnana]
MTDREKERSKVQHTYDVYFDENSPRPPVPGEERAPSASDWTPQMEWTRYKVQSPTQKKCYCSNDPYYETDMCKTRHDRYGSRTPCDNPSPPACLRWSYSLYTLLEDPDGIELFRRYLQSEGRPHADALDFWFACKGLRKQKEPERVQQLIKAIYRRFFLKSALPIKDELRREVGRCVKSSPNLDPPVALFDEAQAQVETLISTTTYPNFLKSEMYLSYIQTAQYPAVGSIEFSSDSSSSGSAVSTRELQNIAAGVGLPTLHEDMEYITSSSAPLSHTPGTGCLSTGYHTPNMGAPRLTKDILLATQRRRAFDVRPKPETFAGMFLYRGVGAHAVYNSYNPVSRQDSELQSLSSHSDARTESDNMSLTDNSVDGKPLSRSSRRQTSMLSKQVQEQAALNKETNMHQAVIPRTQRMDTRQYQATDPSTFAPILIEKLEKVKKEQESQELLNRKLLEGDVVNQGDDKMRNVQSAELANAIREKLLMEDDNDQDILDQHVSRVFSDLTPSRSPGFVSPRPYSPSRNRWAQEQYTWTRRKDKDVFSTFSGDSGNVHDFPENFDHKMNMVKSKSMNEYGDEKFVRGSCGRRSSSKKTINDLTDSGVSVVSDTPPVSMVVKDNRVLAWVMESDRAGRSSGYTHSEMSGKHSRHRKAYSGSRSSSMERTNAGNNLGPAQPFVADPNMPPLSLPNTSIQLEEVRRRLEDDVRTTRFRQKSSNKYLPEVTQSSQSTLRKSIRTKTSPLPVATATQEESTTVVFSFCDEQFPYRTKIPGRHITLNKFKEYLPKKGNYRYFFKTECEELGNQVIQEEVSNDFDIVPLFEGKIMAQFKMGSLSSKQKSSVNIESLRCSNCKLYLSCGPIRLSKDGSICGRCDVKDPSVLRELVLEAALQNVFFPCSYNKFGCQKQLLFGHVSDHEESKCYYVPFNCPDALCNWFGSVSQFALHFIAFHNKACRENMVFTLDLTKDEEALIMYFKSGTPFLLKYQYCKDVGSFTYNIGYFHFHNVQALHKIVLTSNPSNQIIVNLKANRCLFYNHGGNKNECIFLNNYLTILGNPTTIQFSINVNIYSKLLVAPELPLKVVNYAVLETLRCVECHNYLSLPVYTSAIGNICHDCSKMCSTSQPSQNFELQLQISSTIYPCRWKSCNFKDSGALIRKHEQSCKFYPYVCPECKVVLIYNQLFIHLRLFHGTSFFSNRISYTFYMKDVSTRKFVSIINNDLFVITHKARDETHVFSLKRSLNYSNIVGKIHFTHSHCNLKSKTYFINHATEFTLIRDKLPLCYRTNNRLKAVIEV